MGGNPETPILLFYDLPCPRISSTTGFVPRRRRWQDSTFLALQLTKLLQDAREKSVGALEYPVAGPS